MLSVISTLQEFIYKDRVFTRGEFLTTYRSNENKILRMHYPYIYKSMETSAEKVNDKIIAWCHRNIQGRWAFERVDQSFVICMFGFVEKKDALLFELTWNRNQKIKSEVTRIERKRRS